MLKGSRIEQCLWLVVVHRVEGTPMAPETPGCLCILSPAQQLVLGLERYMGFHRARADHSQRNGMSPCCILGMWVYFHLSQVRNSHFSSNRRDAHTTFYLTLPASYTSIASFTHVLRRSWRWEIPQPCVLARKLLSQEGEESTRMAQLTHLKAEHERHHE